VAATSYKIRGIEPPDLRNHGRDTRLMFWGWVVDLGLRAKDGELAKGLDRDGQPLRPISAKTRKYRRSAMTPDGKGDPSAPPLMPARVLSRTRSLLAGRALPTHAEFYWRFDAWTGDSWGRVLAIHARKGRDVIGLSDKGVARVRAQAWDRWERWKRGEAIEPKAKAGTAPGIPKVGSYSTEHATFGIGAAGPGKFAAGEWTGGLTWPEWQRYFRQPNPAKVPIPGRPVGPYNRLLAHVWGQAPPGGPKPAKPKPKPKPARGGFPADPAGLEVVRSLGGSTGAELVKDAAGNLFVRKRGASAEHLREESYADAAYRALGARVPESRLYDTPSGPVKLAKFVEGRTLAEVKRADPALYAKAAEDLKRHFAADALLGNWDVIGLSLDNVLVDARGRAWRIDNGGALRFRAQGARKSAEQWDRYPVELWTLRDASKNPQTAGVFGDLSLKSIAGQVDKLTAEALDKAGLPAEVLATLKGRLAQLRDTAATARTLLADKFKDPYVDAFAKHAVGVRKAGLAERMPAKMTPAHQGGVEPLDEHGKPFDHLRGTGSIVVDFARYVDANGGRYETIRKWADGQAGSSWSAMSQGVKALFADHRTAAESAYFWNSHGAAACKQQLDKMVKHVGGREVLDETFAALHAFTREYLRKADFPGKLGETVRVIRTEPAVAIRGMKVGDQKAIKRGVCESTSIFRSVNVAGSHTTLQEIPLHRVLATYWPSREPGGTSGMFLGDGENEFVCLLEGAPARYTGQQPYSAPH
jgi:hypothetical protein